MTDLAVVEETQAPIQLMMELEQAGAITPTSLNLSDPEMPYQRWEDLGRYLGTVHRSANWWIGDWLNFGEALYGEEAAQGVESTTSERYNEAERVTGLDHGTLMNIRSVCGKVPKENRFKDLGFWLHAEVAKLDPAEQRTWLEQAINNGWTKSTLREQIREAKNPTQDGTGDDAGEGGAPPPVSIAERIETAARLVYEQAQNNSDGDFVVPAEAMVQLRAALGEE